MAVALVVDQLSYATDACLPADANLFSLLAVLVLQLVRAEAGSKQDSRGAKADLLEKYFPASSPFRTWLTDGHGAFVVKRYGGTEIREILKAEQRETEAGEAGQSGASRERGKKRRKRKITEHKSLQREYTDALLDSPKQLPFEIERYFSADEFYSLYTRNDDGLRKAVAATVAVPADEAVRQTLEAAQAHFTTLKGCTKTGYRMIRQLQAMLGDKPAVDVILHEAESRKNSNFKLLLSRILMGKRTATLITVQHVGK